jgi:hypothetical protein
MKQTSPSTDRAYEQTCISYHAIDDFRARLLGFLPIASAGGLFLLVEAKDSQSEGPLVAAGLFGFVVTLGLLAYEIYGIKRCHHLIEYGRRLELDMQLEYGQFQQRPRGVHLRSREESSEAHGVENEQHDPGGFEIDEPVATALIYPAVLAGWAFVAIQTGSPIWAAVVAFLIFIIGFVLIAHWDSTLRREAICWRRSVPGKVRPT